MFRVKVVAPIIILVAVVGSLVGFRSVSPKAQQEIIVQFQQPGMIAGGTDSGGTPFTESVTCPTGYVATGGGYNAQVGLQVNATFAASSTQWQIDGLNGAIADLPYPVIQVLCARSGT